ncbi:heavy metal translocating P-type ATPase [Oceanivirga salmonicida]|uniref:heavy metal translocating P-type ATPase n=1 Tax=Oceanivirga salmonicida TaxID=1769291 RepID=UPI0008304B5B|nr:cation-translocating P-type ATPase [Oceanivirga salmonicida]
MNKKVYKVSNMTCSSCVNKIEKTLEEKGYNSKVNLLSEKLVIYTDNEDKIKEIMNSIGYPISEFKDNKEIEKEQGFLKIIVLLLIAIFSMSPIPVYAKWVLASISMILCYQLLLDGFRNTINLSFNMNSLIFIGSISGYIYSIFNLDKVYFSGITVILFTISLGKLIEHKLKIKSRGLVEKISNLLPKTCNILEDSNLKSINIENLKVGDILVVKEGEIIASDGEVIKGYASVDENSITGESAYISKNVTNKVIGSSIVVEGQINVKVTEIGDDTVISKIANIMEMTQEIKPNISRIADKIASYVIPVVIVIAIFTGIIWYIVTKDMARALNNFMSVLLISCPCSIGLATPASISIGVSLLAKQNILIKDGKALEKAYKISDIVMDKTGTLTKGKPKVVDINLSEEDIEYVYNIEKYVHHPLSNAIVKYLEKEYKPKNIELSVRNFQGLGVFSKPYNIGNKALMLRKRIDISNYEKDYEHFTSQGKTYIYVAKEDKVVGYICLIDDVRKSSIEFISSLKEKNIKPYMLTGDNVRTANYIANKLGIENVKAEVLPYEKSQEIEKISTKDNYVAMVGDGINDAVALKSANIGIAVGKGSDIALSASDVILLKNDLNDIHKLIKISKYTMKNIKENLFFGFIYNMVGIVIATGILGIELSPMLASLFMVMSSISVLLNALRLTRLKVE